MSEHTPRRGRGNPPDKPRATETSGAVFFNPDGTVIDSVDEVTQPALARRRTTKPEGNEAVKPAEAKSAGKRTGKPVKKPASAAKPSEIRTDGSAEDIADDLGDMIHERFMSMLKDKLAENDGYLSDDDVEEMSQELRGQLSDIREVFVTAVESNAKARIARRERTDRSESFKRFMVSKFENRFAPETVVARDAEKLTRRMLPGFFSAMFMLLGPDKLERYEQRAGTITDALRNRLGDDFTWERVYKSTDARKISLRALIDMSWHFQDLDKRIAWLVALVNSNMIPDPDGPAEEWLLTHDSARAVLRDIFSDLVTTLSNKSAHDALVRELGKDRVTTIKAFLHNLY